MRAAPAAAPTRFTAYSRPTVAPAVGALRTIARTRNGSDIPIRNVGAASASTCSSAARQSGAYSRAACTYSQS